VSPLGKLTPAEFERAIAPHLGARREEVLVGPGVGRDAAILRLGAGRVMAMTTDPISMLPGLEPAESAWLSCHLLASDLWTTGIPPTWASVCFNLPPRLRDEDFSAYAAAMGEEFARLGVAVVTGHTGRYPGCDLTILGAATLAGAGDDGRWVGPQFVVPGDRLLMTKDCAVEATAIAARLYPRRLGERLDEEQMARAVARFADVSVVADCRAALRVGVRDRGVSSLHDATEGGVLGGLVEMARACGCDLRVFRSAIPVSPESRAVCEMFGIDPYWTLSEGTLLITARAGRAADVAAAIAEDGIAVTEIGEVVRGSGVLYLTEPDGGVTKLTEPEADPYWAAYEKAGREAWR
jgi:hydrogenase maturation factor